MDPGEILDDKSIQFLTPIIEKSLKLINSSNLFPQLKLYSGQENGSGIDYCINYVICIELYDEDLNVIGAWGITEEIFRWIMIFTTYILPNYIV